MNDEDPQDRGEISLDQLEIEAQRVLQEAENAYWDLLAAREGVRLAELHLGRGQHCSRSGVPSVISPRPVEPRGGRGHGSVPVVHRPAQRPRYRRSGAPEWRGHGYWGGRSSY